MIFFYVAQFLSALCIISVSLTMTLFSEKILIFNRCISGSMPNLIKKSWKVSNLRGLNFAVFRPTYPHLSVDSFYPEHWQKQAFFGPPTHLILFTSLLNAPCCKLFSLWNRIIIMLKYKHFSVKLTIFFSFSCCSVD